MYMNDMVLKGQDYTKKTNNFTNNNLSILGTLVKGNNFKKYCLEFLGYALGYINIDFELNNENCTIGMLVSLGCASGTKCSLGIIS